MGGKSSVGSLSESLDFSSISKDVSGSADGIPCDHEAKFKSDRKQGLLTLVFSLGGGQGIGGLGYMLLMLIIPVFYDFSKELYSLSEITNKKPKG